MPKMRVYEYAKNLGMQAKEMLSVLAKLGHPDKTMFSGLDEETIADINRHVAGRIGGAPVTVTPAEEPKAVERPAEKPAPKAKEHAPKAAPPAAKGKPASSKEPPAEARKAEPPRQMPTIRIIRREDIEKKREEDKLEEERRLADARAEAEHEADRLAGEERRRMAGLAPVEVVAPPVAPVEVAPLDTPVDGFEPVEEPIGMLAPVDTFEPVDVPVEPPVADPLAPPDAVPADAPVAAPVAPPSAPVAKPVQPVAGDKSGIIRPIRPVLAVQPIGRAQGMAKPVIRTETRPEDYSLEELERVLLGRTSVRPDGPGGVSSAPVRPGEAPRYERARQYSASGQRLNTFDTSKGRKHKTSRKEKKAAMKAKEKADDVRRVEFEKVQEEKEMKEGKIIKLEDAVTVRELCELIDVPRTEVVKKIMNLGIMNINQKLTIDVATLIAEEYGFQVKMKAAEESEDVSLDEPDIPENMVERSPVVTVMGHVDHGKTSLLDAIRQTDVAAGEAGGITQHIGSYQVMLKNGRKVTFLDTPGHEAFTAMRAHGAAVTDITILVVGADDGVQPQTVEAMDHSIAAGVPIIVAINKIDKAEADIPKVKQELAAHGLTPEDWGGETTTVEVSAKKRINIDSLLDMVLLIADMKDLKADPKRRAMGVVIEAQLDKGKGPVANILVQKGTLNLGDAVVIGGVYGKVRALYNDKGKNVKSAGPSMPVQLVGISGLPNVGEKFYVLPSEKLARTAAERVSNQIKATAQAGATKKISLNQLFDVIKKGEIKDLNIVVKSDVIGSSIALKESLEKLQGAKVRVNVVHSGIGQISENDVMLASASNALIVGFHVRPSSAAEKLAQSENVEIRVYRIIYDCLNEVKLAMEGLLDPTFRETVVGRAEVRETFKIPDVGIIAGCHVIEGKIVRNGRVRLVRDGVEVYEGTMRSLKRFKEDVTEVEKGYECGLGIDKFNDIKVKDVIEVILSEQVAAASGEAHT